MHISCLPFRNDSKDDLSRFCIYIKHFILTNINLIITFLRHKNNRERFNFELTGEEYDCEFKQRYP